MILSSTVGTLPVQVYADDYAVNDISASAPVPINEENFPDSNFRTFVQNFDTDGDGTLASGELDRITDMDVGSRGIQNLKGIERFTALQVLDCHDN